jgi:hypothetical protein
MIIVEYFCSNENEPLQRKQERDAGKEKTKRDPSLGSG